MAWTPVTNPEQPLQVLLAPPTPPDFLERVKAAEARLSDAESDIDSLNIRVTTTELDIDDLYLRDAATDARLDILEAPISARWQLSANQSPTVSIAGTTSQVLFNSAVHNTSGGTITNDGTGIITVSATGVYLIEASITIQAPGASGLARAILGLETGPAVTAAVGGDYTLAASGTVGLHCSTTVNLAGPFLFRALVELFGSAATATLPQAPTYFGAARASVPFIQVTKVK